MRAHIPLLVLALFVPWWGSLSFAQTAPTSKPLAMPTQVVEAKRKLNKKVVLVGMQGRFSAESWPEAEARTMTELRALGFQVVHVESRAAQLEARMAELGAQAANAGALGSVRIVRQGGQQVAQIWLHDALTGKMLLRKIKIGMPGSAEAGIRVVELIYASLLETQLRDPTRTPQAIRELVKARVVRARAPRGAKKPSPRSARWALSISPALQLNPGQSDPELGLSMALERWLVSQLSLGFAFFASAGPGSVSSAAGEADLQLSSGLIELTYRPWSEARLCPAVSAGVGALFLRAGGHAMPPYGSTSEWAVSGAARLGLRGALRVASALWVRLSAEATFALPAIKVKLADEEIASLGRPLLSFGLGLQWRWR